MQESSELSGMVGARLAGLIKVVGVFAVALMGVAQSPANGEEMLFDRGLPVEHLNIEPDGDRSNIRWQAGFENNRFYGDDFIIGNPGERYIIDHVRTWAVLGYREDGPIKPETIGDWFSQVRLLGGEVSDERLSVLSSGNLNPDGNSASNGDIVLTQVNYPDSKGSVYFNFGPTIPIWQIDFYNLNWVIEGGTRYNFSVQGIGRLFPGTDHYHAWYNHASNATLSGAPQQAADDLMLVFSNTGEFLHIADGENDWNKSTDLNIQIFGEAIKSPEVSAARDDGEITLVEIVQNLNEAGFLTGKAYRRALREVEQGVIQLRSRLLHLVEAQSQPKLEEDGNIIRLPRIVFYAEDNGGLREEDIQAWIEQFEELGFPASSLPNFQTAEQTREILDRLNETGVLSERAYTALQNSVATTGVHIESQLHRDAAIQMSLDEALDPELVEPQLEKWREANILSDSGYAALMQDLKDAALDKPIEFLRYLDKALLFDRQAYPLDPEIYYPDIYQTVAQKLAQTGVLDSEFGTFELEFVLHADYEQLADLSPTILAMDQSEPKVYDAVISAPVNGRTYQQASYYGNLDDREDAVARIGSEGIINFFNKILRDQTSPYRLYSVSDFYGLLYGLDDHHRFGILALTEAQARIYFGDRYETDYEEPLTSDRIEEILALFEEIGLLDHLNDTEIAEGRMRIARAYITDPHQLLTAFKDVVLVFDWESGNVDNPYQELTEKLAAISHENFNPTDISNGYDWENESASQSFTLNGTQYSIELEFNGDWLDSEFFEFIKAATANEVPQGQFYLLSDDYETIGYIFLSKAQFEALRSQQLITLPDDEI